MSPFDGAPPPLEAEPVTERWAPTDSRWKAAAADLELELGRFRRGNLSTSEAKRIRLVLGRATELSIVETDAAALGRRLALLALSIVKARIDHPEPPYPKSRTASAREAYRERVRAWEVGLSAMLARRFRHAAKQLRLRDLAPVLRVLRRERGPAPPAMVVAMRVYGVLAGLAPEKPSPRATTKLTPALSALLESEMKRGGSLLKPLREIRMHR